MIYVPYIVVSIVAVILGQLSAHFAKKLPPVVSEEITYKEFFLGLKSDFKIDFKYSAIFILLFNMLVWHIPSQVTVYIYAVTIFALSIAFSVDYRFQLIPDETHAVIALMAIINLSLNISNWWNYLLGAIIGGGIFWLLGLTALIFLKKEGMGFGDVKLMAALGLLFGIKYILVICLVSFFLGAIVGGFLIIIRKKETDSYMPFGPFIVIAAILLMFVPADYIIEIYINFCAYIGMKMSDVVYFFVQKFS